MNQSNYSNKKVRVEPLQASLPAGQVEADIHESPSSNHQ